MVNGPVNGVIFDLDGTLVDSAPDIHGAANALLRKLDCPILPFEQVRGFIGNGIPKLVERVMKASDIEFTPARHSALASQFEKLYATNPTAKSQLYPGVPVALTRFRAQGLALGVCTNKNHGLTLQVLSRLGIAEFFDSVIGGDSLPVRKPDSAPLLACAKALRISDMVFVGDSEVDAATAAAAKVPFLLYTQGYRKGPVAAMAFDHAFDHFKQLGALVESHFKNPSVA